MQRILIVLALVVTFTTIASRSQAQIKQGDNLLNLGFGLNSYYTGGIPLSVSYEYAVNNLWSVGGGLDYLSYHYGAAGVNYRFTALYIGGRASYHFNEVFNINDKSWDVYGGATLGYRSFSWGDNYNGYNSGVYNSGLFLGIHAGARYYFSPKAGAFLELGALGSTNARIGVTLKF